MRIFRIPAALTFCLGAMPALAETTVHSVYQTRYIGLPLSRALIALTFSDSEYAFNGSGRASTLASLFKPMNATLKAKGHFAAHAVKPDSFEAKITGKGSGYNISLNFLNGNISKEISLPKRDKPPPDFVPVTEAMKRGVIDPLSAFLIPIKAGTLDDVCKRTLPVYTGRERFDIVLAPARKEVVFVPGLFEGEAFVCSGRYKPFGGHRSEKSEVIYMTDNRDMEAAFVPLPGGRAMGLYRVSIGTRLGPLTVELEKATVVQGNAEAAPAKNKGKKS